MADRQKRKGLIQKRNPLCTKCFERKDIEKTEEGFYCKKCKKRILNPNYYI